MQDALDESDEPDPRIGSALSDGWQSMKGHFLVFLLAVLVLAVLDAPLELGNPGEDGEDISPSFGFGLFAYWLLFLPVIDYSVDLIFLRGGRGDSVDIKEISTGFQQYLNVILASLLVFGLIGIALVVFIIPGLYVASRLAFVSYLVMDEGLDPVEAVEGSWRITRGHAWKTFGLGFVSMLLGAGGLLLMVVGIIPAIMWAKASFAAMYLEMTGQEIYEPEYVATDEATFD